MVIQGIQNIIISYSHNKYSVDKEYNKTDKEYRDLGMYSEYPISTELQQFVNIVRKFFDSPSINSNISSRWFIRLTMSDYIRYMNMHYFNHNKFLPDKVLSKVLKCYKPFTMTEAFSYTGHHFRPPHVWRHISRTWK